MLISKLEIWIVHTSIHQVDVDHHQIDIMEYNWLYSLEIDKKNLHIPDKNVDGYVNIIDLTFENCLKKKNPLCYYWGGWNVSNV